MHVVRIGLIAICWSLVTLASAGESPVGKKIEPFKLQDHLGAWHSLDELPKDHAVVVAFLGTECPLAKLYGPRLAKIASDYKDKPISFIAIDPTGRIQSRRSPITPKPLNSLSQSLRMSAIKSPMPSVPCGLLKFSFSIRTALFAITDASMISTASATFDPRRPATIWSSRSTNFSPVRRSPPRRLPLLAASSVVFAPPAGLPTSPTASRSRGFLQQRCVECHREGAIAPFALTNYEDAAGWGETVLEVIQAQRMPPWHASPEHGDFINDARMPESEKELVAAWVKAGMPEGDRKDLPEAPTFSEGWRISKPDLVLEMADDYAVPAEGEIPYQYFVMDPKLTEDKWVVGAECLAGNPTVVHHIIAFVIPPEVAKDIEVGHFAIEPSRSTLGRQIRGGSENSGRKDRPKIVSENVEEKQQEKGRRRSMMPADVNKRIALMRSWFTNFLVAMAPGSPPMILNDGMAKRLPAGCKIVFQSHYTPVGKATTDRSKIGLVFTTADKIKHEVVTRVSWSSDSKFRLMRITTRCEERFASATTVS